MVAIVAALLGATLAVLGYETSGPHAGISVYAPQPERNVGWIGPVDDVYTGHKTAEAVADDRYEVVDAFRRKGSVGSLFGRVRTLAQSSKARGLDLRIIEYFEPTVWFRTNSRTLAPYAARFRPSWLLRDARGKIVPYYGVGHSASSGAAPIGYLINLGDPSYRRWVVSTLVQWMHKAPFSGVFFDSAQPLIPSQHRAPVGDGESFATIFCGPDAPPSGCLRLQLWNAGLLDLMTRTSAALHPEGDEVVYNGISPSPVRGPSRNLGLLARTDMAADESFCYDVEAGGKPVFAPLVADLRLMRAIAEASKKVMEITNYQTSANRHYGSYCLAAFLLGWQPGSSYWLYQRTYSDGIDQSYPEIAERDLNLGKPLTATFERRGSILLRRFTNGLVALNPGPTAARLRAPLDAVQFSGGVARRAVTEKAPLAVAPRAAVFLLSDDYLESRG